MPFVILHNTRLFAPPTVSIRAAVEASTCPNQDVRRSLPAFSAGSSTHLLVLRAPLRARDPQYVVAPYQHLPQHALAVARDEFLRVAQLNVHVAVGADEISVVLCLAPLQPDDDLAAGELLDKGFWVDGVDLRKIGVNYVPVQKCVRGVRLTEDMAN